jgi:uncharacterized pyridoxamine 5'-phosphate oxidase family protein
MVEISENIIEFFKRQAFVVVSTIDSQGFIYSSAKGIAAIEPSGKVHLIDLYMGRTISHLKENPIISITAINEDYFQGYTLRGKARLVDCKKIEQSILHEWEERIISRISARIIKNIKKEKGSYEHPESLFPKPKCLIKVEVEDIVDLAPGYLKQPF